MKQAVSFLIIFQLLLHTAGITLSAHWCKGRIVRAEVSLAKKDVSCNQAYGSENCKNRKPQSLKSTPSCCLTNHFKVETDDDYISKLKVITGFHLQIIPEMFCEAISSKISASLSFLPCNHDPPPGKHTLILHQVFRC